MVQEATPQSAYYLKMSTPQNVVQQFIENFATLDYTRSVNAPGAMTIVMPLSKIDISLLIRDTRFEIWRSLGGDAYLETGTQWLMRRRRIDKDAQMVTIACESGLTLLSRRVVAYNAGSAQTSKNDNADNMIVEFVKENLGSSATDDDRNWATLIAIIDGSGGGPVVKKSASRRNLLTTIQDVAKQANVQGTPVFF